MATAPEGDELIDVIVRLPRQKIEDMLLSTVTAADQDQADADRRYRDAKALVTGRRRRAACFDGLRFCDPAWEMILELYVATREGRRLSVTQLCSLSGAATTSALRHVDHLHALGYIARDIDLADRRRANVSMLAPLKEAVEHWLDLQFAASRIGA